MNKFMAENFDQLAQKDEFVQLNEEEILFLFKSTKTKYSSEEIKWDAALKWCKHQPQRTNVFPRLFKLIKLDDLSLDFIREVVRSEPLVRESRECAVFLLDVFSARSSDTNQPSSVQPDIQPQNVIDSPTHDASYTAREVVRLPTPQPDTGHVRGFTHLNPHIICLKSGNGEINAWNINTNTWHHIPNVKKSYDMQIVNVNNDLYTMSGNQLFQMERMRSWIEKTSIPLKPGWSRLVSFQGKIYLVQKDAMLCFDPARNGWESDLPGCGLEDGLCVAATNNFIYAMGGIGTNHDAVRFDPETQTLSKILSMMKGRWRASAAVLDEKVYATGGYEKRWMAQKSVECFDHETKSWSEVADMLVERENHFSCVIDNKLYVVGGKDRNNEFTNSIEVYNASSNQWSMVQTEGLPRDAWLKGCVYYM